LFDLKLLDYMGVSVIVFGDSQLVFQQILEEYQYLDGILNDYLERCWNIVAILMNLTFNIYLELRIPKLMT
jgi:hypothetical protein